MDQCEDGRQIVHVDQGEGYAKRYLTNTYDHARGWGYVEGRPATGSMTTAGCANLIICHELLERDPIFRRSYEVKVRQSILDSILPEKPTAAPDCCADARIWCIVNAFVS